ncbi:MAG: hypothetical protein OEZ48_00225 [Candidatus Bathyarchaeota archaeon]|nr:hypothetical protein [Candidatus Bathyarchaeota archaeon]MDH5686282.1 hypothetical protein [Candidatus Bathyarchaeota archaeon]
MSREKTSRYDVLDFVISTLTEHEKTLSEIEEKLEALCDRLEKIIGET